MSLLGEDVKALMYAVPSRVAVVRHFRLVSWNKVKSFEFEMVFQLLHCVFRFTWRLDDSQGMRRGMY